VVRDVEGTVIAYPWGTEILDMVNPTAEQLAAAWEESYRAQAEVRIETGFAVPADRASTWATERAGELVTGVDQTTRDRIGEIVARALADPNVTQADIERAIRAEFTEFSAYRAEMIARTEIAIAANNGDLALYRDLGSQYVEVSDGVEFDEECRSADGQVWSLDYAGVNATAHPNAVFEGSAFGSYGDLLELRRARYSGPAVRVTTADGHTTTIGPHHPMLTKDGEMTEARLLREGQELVYDGRLNRLGAWSGAVLDHEQVPAIEDVFEAILPRGAYAVIPAASDDFHGDGQFCEGEVEVVNPARELMQEWDLGRPQESRELVLVGSDVHLEAKAGHRSALPSKQALLLAASGNVGSGATVAGHLRLLPIISVEHIHFTGYAFDGTTKSSLYCSDGFVVSNCSRVFSDLSTEDALRRGVDEA
jgi:hypothetical protein